MTDAPKPPGGWPGAPGVPLNPERDGWHMLRSRTNPTMTKRADWSGREQFWEPCVSPEDVAAYWNYEGCFYTPAEVAARGAEAREAGMREAAKIARVIVLEWQNYEDNTDADALAKDIAAAILAAIEKDRTP